MLSIPPAPSPRSIKTAYAFLLAQTTKRGDLPTLEDFRNLLDPSNTLNADDKIQRGKYAIEISTQPDLTIDETSFLDRLNSMTDQDLAKILGFPLDLFYYDLNNIGQGSIAGYRSVPKIINIAIESKKYPGYEAVFPLYKKTIKLMLGEENREYGGFRLDSAINLQSQFPKILIV